MEAEKDLNFIRAMTFLEDRVVGAHELITYWRAAGSMSHIEVPPPEVVKPWWKDIETLLLSGNENM